MSTAPKINFQPVPFSTTLLVRDSCLCLHAQRAARALARRFDEALKPAGLTNGQFSLLMSLNRTHPDGTLPPGVPPATMGSVAQLLGMDRTTLTAAVKTLERRGLLAVQTGPSDKRAKLLVLTAEGRQALALATPIWTATHAEVERGLDSPTRLRAELCRLAGHPPAATDQPPCATTSATANPS